VFTQLRSLAPCTDGKVALSVDEVCLSVVM